MTDPAPPLALPRSRPDLIAFLKNRRSNLAKFMEGPGPDPAQVKELLTLAARVPDHRKLTPWRFILIQGTARERLGETIETSFKKDNPSVSDPARLTFECARFLRAPLSVAVVFSPQDCPRGTPLWEQQLSSAVCCYNLLLGAQAMGFGAQWLTEWVAYHPDVHDHLGLRKDEKIAGFIYIGTVKDIPQPRVRPDLENIVKTL